MVLLSTSLFCDFDGEKIRFQVRVFLLGLDLTDLVVGLDPNIPLMTNIDRMIPITPRGLCGCITAGYQVHLLA